MQYYPRTVIQIVKNLKKVLLALSGLDRIREAARKDKDVQFTSLMHHITVDLLRESYMSLKRDAAPGVDDVTWRQYGEQLATDGKGQTSLSEQATVRQQPKVGAV